MFSFLKPDKSEMIMTEHSDQNHPHLGFVGLGWIGLKRLQPLADNGWDGELTVFDPDQLAVRNTLSAFPKAKSVNSFKELIDLDLDGVVIATPSALHANQTEQALRDGLPVFCQKPLGRNLDETERVVSLAQANNLLLGVDFSYRFTEGIQEIKAGLKREELGEIYAIEAVFHNAYGPDKEWYYTKEKSGGGCLIDLGSHLVDLIQYLLDDGDLEVVYSNLLAKGKSIQSGNDVEDFAEAQLMTAKGVSVRLACSWKHAVGKDADIYVKINGTGGGFGFHNVKGSFYEFKAEKYNQNNATTLSSTLDNWEGKTLCNWVEELKKGHGFDPQSIGLINTAKILDDIYSKAGR